MNYIIIISVILLLAVVYIAYQYRKIKNMPNVQDNKHLVVLNDQNLTNHISKGVILIDFWAAWCMPCKMIAPVINELADEMKDQSVSIAKLNVDENQQSAQKFGVRSIPTLIILKNGKEVERIVGIKSKSIIKNSLEKHL